MPAYVAASGAVILSTGWLDPRQFLRQAVMGNTKCVYASDNHSCFFQPCSSLLNPFVLRVSRRLCWRNARFSRSTKLVLIVALVGNMAKSAAIRQRLQHDFVVDRHHVTRSRSDYLA